MGPTDQQLPYALEKLPKKPDLTGDDFFALDLRAGRVVEVEEFPEARKPAYKMTVDFGPLVGTLQTSAQITNYSMDELRDRMVAGAINLGTKRIAGFVSEFLILGTLDRMEPCGCCRSKTERSPGPRSHSGQGRRTQTGYFPQGIRRIPSNPPKCRIYEELG